MPNTRDSFEEWLKILEKALLPIINMKTKSTIKTSYDNIPCSCGYPRTTPTDDLLSDGGAPLPERMCPFGVLIMKTIGIKNSYVILFEEKPSVEDAVELIPGKLYIAYSKEPLTGGVIVYRRIDAGDKYQPVERAIM